MSAACTALRCADDTGLHAGGTQHQSRRDIHTHTHTHGSATPYDEDAGRPLKTFAPQVSEEELL